MIKECKICGNEGPFIYTSIDYKMVPLCKDCYQKHRKQLPAKNKYKKLMNKLSNKGYMWILNVGENGFPFTFFGLEISFYQIVQYFFRFINSDKYSLQSQEDFVFDFDDYSDPIITETCITFINDDDNSTYSINIRMGLFDYDNKELLFFTDKQLGLSKSNLENYASLIIEDNGEITEVVPDFESSYIPYDAYDDYSEDEFKKTYFDSNDLKQLIGATHDIDY